jgi:hypothetical protein
VSADAGSAPGRRQVSLGGALALACGAIALLPSPASGSRPPTDSENDSVRSAFREAHYRTDDGVKLKSVREVRVSSADQRWAAVIYKKGKGGRKRAATATDFFLEKSLAKWKPRKKGQVPAAIKRDLKQSPHPYTVTVRYAGSGSFTSDSVESEPGYDQHASGTFNWDLTWEGVELYDDHYPGHSGLASSPQGGGTWSVTSESPPCSATGEFRVAPIMHEFNIEKGSDYETADLLLRYPWFVSTTGCGYYTDIWDQIAARALGVALYDPPVRGIPIFPERPIEATLSSKPGDVADVCKDGDLSFPGECTLDWSATVTVTPTP